MNKNFWFGTLVLVMILGISAAGYGQNRSLDGLWLEEDGFELRLNNGAFEIRLNNESLGIGSIFITRGTFTVGVGNITVTYTHYHGNFLSEMGLEVFGIHPERWYSMDELRTAIISSPMGDFAPLLLQEIAPLYTTEIASVSNNSLTLMYGSFTRR